MFYDFMKKTLLLLTFVSFLFNSYCAEYFVSVSGNDLNSGLTPAKAFGTVSKGVSLLKSGDILTLLPGEYYESVFSDSISGEKGSPVKIRAKIPGTVVIRGDKEFKGTFEKEKGFHFVYSAPCPTNPQGVIERDSLKIYNNVGTPKNVEYEPSSYYYDEKERKLYIHTSDGKNPDMHLISLSHAGRSGMAFVPPRKKWTTQKIHDVIIDGLYFSGFIADTKLRETTGGCMGAAWGLFIFSPTRCVVRNCRAFLNGGGIAVRGQYRHDRHMKEKERGVQKVEDCLIEDCVAYGNYSKFSSSGGNIICFGRAENTVIQNCIAFGTETNGIRFYQNRTENCSLLNNIAWKCDYGNIWDKTSPSSGNIIRENISVDGRITNYGLDNDFSENFIYTSVGGPAGARARVFEGNIIIGVEHEKYTPEKDFADIKSLDYRLQSNSKYRKAGKNGRDMGPRQYEANVFFVKPDGNDENEGTSVLDAWKTLKKACAEVKAGDTVYMLPGKYNETISPEKSGTKEKPVIFRARGNSGKVFIEKAGTGISLRNKSFIQIEGIKFTGLKKGAEITKTSEITLKNCVFNGGGISAVESEGLKIKHSIIYSTKKFGVNLIRCSNTQISADIFGKIAGTPIKTDIYSLKTLFCDYNSFDLPAKVLEADKKVFSLQKIRDGFNLAENSFVSEVKLNPDDLSIANPWNFAGKAASAMNAGPFVFFKSPPLPQILHPEVFSVSATSANIQWWTNRPDVTTGIKWGEFLRKEKRQEKYLNSNFHSMSLIGLKPGTKYFFRIMGENPLYEVHDLKSLAAEDASKKRTSVESPIFSFTTLKKDPPPKAYHVAVNGSDTQDGLSINRAFKTISHATDTARPGDTIIVHEGNYPESVMLKNTGTSERPITIRGDWKSNVSIGGNNTIPYAFFLMNKSNICIDNFYFFDFQRDIKSESAQVFISGGTDNTVRRCIFDARANTQIELIAKYTENTLVENCVFRNPWVAVSTVFANNMTVRNCVFYGSAIRPVKVIGKDTPVFFSHNIFMPNVAWKTGNAFIHTSHIETIKDDHNCFFGRLPEKEKFIYEWKRRDHDKSEQERRSPKIKLDEFKKITGQKTSFYADPELKLTKGFEWGENSSSHWQEKQIVRRNGKSVFLKPFFEEFFATSPECLKASDGKVIGLDRKAFKGIIKPSRNNVSQNK